MYRCGLYSIVLPVPLMSRLDRFLSAKFAVQNSYYRRLQISRFPKKLTDQLVQSLLASDPQETAKMIAPSRGMADRLCTSFLTDPVYSSLSLPRTYPVLGSTQCTIWQTVQLTVS
jgi:hypothetical protein